MGEVPDYDKIAGHHVGQFMLVCDKYKCEMVKVEDTKFAKFGVKHGVGGKIAKIRGLAVTQMPTERHYIPKVTFETMLKDPETTLVGRPIADRHGYWPWEEISVAQTLGVVTKAWFSPDYESLLFEAEIWDEKAINSIQSGTQKLFSIAYYYDYQLKNKRNWYDESETMMHVSWMECNHLALLSDPQVLEAEILEDMQMLDEHGCVKYQKEYPHTSDFYSGEVTPWGSIDKTRLPFDAFVFEIGEKGKKSTYKYPHHWVARGKMYLHRQGLAVAIAAAKGARSGKIASPEVFTHLNKHLEEISMTQEQILQEFKEFLTTLEYPVDDIIQWYGSDEYKQIIGDVPMADEGNGAEGQSVDPKPENALVAEVVDEPVQDEPITDTPVADAPVSEESAEQETPAQEPVEEPVEPVQDSVVDNTEDKHVENGASVSIHSTTNDEYQMLVQKYETMKLERDSAIQKQLDLENKIRFGFIEKKVDSMIRSGKFGPNKKESLLSLLTTLNDEQISLFEKTCEGKTTVSFDEKGVTVVPEEPEKPKEMKNSITRSIPGYAPDPAWKIK